MKTLAGTELWPAQEDRTTPENEGKNASNSKTSRPTPSKIASNSKSFQSPKTDWKYRTIISNVGAGEINYWKQDAGEERSGGNGETNIR